jgi:DNA-binding transcriptional ArsR family regulator
VVEQYGSVGSLPNPAILDEVFSALADGTRRDMLRRLTAGERTISDLAEPYDMSFEAASKHVRVLERAGLVRRSVRGRNHYCQLDASRLAEADRWLSFYQQFWMERFAALDRVLARRGSTRRKR